MLAPSSGGDEKQAGVVDLANPSCPSAGEQGQDAPAARAGKARLRAVVSRLVRRPQLWAACILLGLLAGGAVVVRPHVQAWYHLRAARWEDQHWHNAQVIRHLQVCLRVWPHDPSVLLLAARSTRRARGYAEAERLLEMYQQARGLDDACTLEQLLLSAERRIDPVLELCWHYVEQGNPDTPLILEALTRGYLRQYRLGEARLCLDRWQQIEPDNPQAFYLEGLYYLDYEHGRSAAEKSCRRVLELDPDHEEAHQGLAVALLDGRNFSEAAQHLEYLCQRQPDNLRLQVGLAECLDGLGQQEKALRIVDNVLAQKPDFVPALSLRGQLAIKGGQFEDAESWLRQAVRLDPINYRARYSLILCLHQNGKEEEARQLQRQFEQLEEDLARFNDIITKEIVQRPRDPALHCTLGQILLRGGQCEEGLRWLQSALRLDPHYAPARQAVEEYQKKVQAEARQADMR